MRTVFSGGRVFDPRGLAFVSTDVAVEGERVVALGTGLTGDRTVDVSGRTLLPGFVDCHVHLMMRSYAYPDHLTEPFSLQFFNAVDNMARTLKAGVTTVRDAWGADAGTRAAVDLGRVRGPRVRITIAMVSRTGGSGDLAWSLAGRKLPFWPEHPGRPSGVADGPVEIRRKVRELVRMGADGIKLAASGHVYDPAHDPLLPQLTEDELAAAVDEATAAGKWAMAHCHSPVGALRAVRAGVRSIDHGTYLDEEVIALMAERGTWLVPTLMAADSVLTDPAASEARLARAHRARDALRQNVRRAAAAGVPIAMGSDCPMSPHGTNLRELALLVDAGLTPEAALRAGTLAAADLLDLGTELGTLEPGKRADLVVLRGDPGDVTDYAGRIDEVWQDGEPVVRAGEIVYRSA